MYNVIIEEMYGALGEEHSLYRHVLQQGAVCTKTLSFKQPHWMSGSCIIQISKRLHFTQLHLIQMPQFKKKL